MVFRIILFSIFYIFFWTQGFCQVKPIIGYSVNDKNQVELKINSSDQNYYVLQYRHHPDSLFTDASSICLGDADSMIISEPLRNYPENHYQILEYSISNPGDFDGDGINDIIEFQNIPAQNPLNAASEVDSSNGMLILDEFSSFQDLSIKKDEVQWSEFLNEVEFLKYIITDFFSEPKIYFINSNNHSLHKEFADAIGIEYLADNIKKGEIAFHPNSISSNGTLGTFSFNYSNGLPQDFSVVQRTQELLAANMSFIENNLSYFVTENNTDQYLEDSTAFKNSRVSILFESDIYSGLNYWGLNQTEGYGFFKKLDLQDIPDEKDIVLYESIPNSLPRVGGIMTSAIQTPLSHVNLRAIQNKIPNAFIRNAHKEDSILDLLDDYIYYKVEKEGFVIRKASQEEVKDWYENLRPEKEQIPPLNLKHKSILSTDDIKFEMYDAFGAKCANIATMQTFGFPDKTIPEGYGVPFYFYQEFMKENDFFEEVKSMIADSGFIADRKERSKQLKAFRKKIKSADMPSWMMDELDEMHKSFPEGTSIRCRSSSNNEDLPGFNGAGLYSSKTQHPDEGHISKSIKQVFASLWNLRAFEEREFYRVNHYKSSMGVLCHPNFSDEKANGVGVSSDPVYSTDNSFYLNTQIGEDLITNPDAKSVPEEILLYTDEAEGHLVLAKSNLVPSDSNVMSDEYLDEMRTYLTTILNKFESLYQAEGNSTFAMDIEYKITDEDQLVIKQARPWVAYKAISKTPSIDSLELSLYPNPATDYIQVGCESCDLSKIRISNILGQQMDVIELKDSKFTTKVKINQYPKGIYILSGISEGNSIYESKKFVKQ